MKKLIENKNKLLMEMSDRLSEVGDVAKLLRESTHLSSASNETFLNIVADKLDSLAMGWSIAYFESQKCEPEAVKAEEEPYVPPVEDTEGVLV